MSRKRRGKRGGKRQWERIQNAAKRAFAPPPVKPEQILSLRARLAQSRSV